MAIDQFKLYGSEKIRIEASRVPDIIGFVAISAFLLIIVYFFFNAPDSIISSFDEIGDNNIEVILSYVNSLFLDFQITKIQLILAIPFLLVFIIWLKSFKDFLKNDSGLVIDKNGISYAPAIFKSEEGTGFKLDWSEIDRFEIDEGVNIGFMKLLDIQVYLKPGLSLKPKSKLEKFIFDIGSRIAGAANIDTSKIRRSHKIKRLNADMNEVKKILDKHLNDYRKHKERMQDFEKISS